MPNKHRGFGIHRNAQYGLIFISLFVQLVQLFENGIRFGYLLLRSTLLDASELVVQFIEFDPNGLFGGQFFICVALLQNQLLAHLLGSEASVQTGRLEGRINLTLLIGNSLDIFQ